MENMLSKDFEIPGSIICKLKYLSDLSTIDEIGTGNESNILVAECHPIKKITHQQATNFPVDQIKVVLEELKKIEKENLLFYAHFDIDYDDYHIGPTYGGEGIVFKFLLKPKIKKIKNNGFITE